jgi:hypothetical protein
MKLVAIGLLALGCAALSCGSSDGDPAAPAGTPAVSQSELAAKVADAICTNVGKCCADHGFGYNTSKCTAAVQSEVQQTLAAVANADGLTYDANAAGECVQRYRELAAACVFSDEQRDAVLQACGAIWSGNTPEGAPCVVDHECQGASQGEAYCAKASSAAADSAGVCAPVAAPVHGALDGACDTSCRAGSAAAACAALNPSALPGCWLEDGLYCDSTTGKCVALAGHGQPCTSMAPCVQGSYCKEGTCAARVALAGACDEAGLADPCVEGAFCASGKCEALKADGANCLQGSQCASLRCEAGTCRPANLAAAPATCGGI